MISPPPPATTPGRCCRIAVHRVVHRRVSKAGRAQAHGCRRVANPASGRRSPRPRCCGMPGQSRRGRWPRKRCHQYGLGLGRHVCAPTRDHAGASTFGRGARLPGPRSARPACPVLREFAPGPRSRRLHAGNRHRDARQLPATASAFVRGCRARQTRDRRTTATVSKSRAHDRSASSATESAPPLQPTNHPRAIRQVIERDEPGQPNLCTPGAAHGPRFRGQRAPGRRPGRGRTRTSQRSGRVELSLRRQVSPGASPCGIDGGGVLHNGDRRRARTFSPTSY